MKFYDEEKDISEPATIADVMEHYWSALSFARKIRTKAEIGIALALVGIVISLISLFV